MQRVFSSSIYVVSEADGSVLLERHNLLNMWLAPGGHRDGHERPSETALRELREETGIVDVKLPIVVGSTVPGFLTYEEHIAESIDKLFMNHVFIGMVPHARPIQGDNEYSAYAWTRKVQDAPWVVDSMSRIARTPVDVIAILDRISKAWNAGAFKRPLLEI